MRFVLLAITALALTATSAKAQLLDFAFTTTASDGKTISGEIVGLQSSGTSTPADIIIFSQPTGYIYPAEDLVANGYQFLPGADTFTVTNGVITGADAGIYKLIGTQDIQGYGFDVSYQTFTDANGIYQSVGGTATTDYNLGSLAGTVYTPVPEPHATMAIFLLAGLGLLVTRKLRARFRDNPPGRSFACLGEILDLALNQSILR